MYICILGFTFTCRLFQKNRYLYAVHSSTASITTEWSWITIMTGGTITIVIIYDQNYSQIPSQL